MLVQNRSKASPGVLRAATLATVSVAALGAVAASAAIPERPTAPFAEKGRPDRQLLRIERACFRAGLVGVAVDHDLRPGGEHDRAAVRK
jgi:hypothetical protein